MKLFKLRMILLPFVLVGAFGLTGCETTQGLGEDIQQGGEEMEEAVEE